MMAEILLFPRKPRCGSFYPVRLADQLWYIDHESASGGSFGIVSDIGPYRDQEEAQAVADQLNAVAWTAPGSGNPPEGGAA